MSSDSEPIGIVNWAADEENEEEVEEEDEDEEEEESEDEGEEEEEDNDGDDGDSLQDDEIPSKKDSAADYLPPDLQVEKLVSVSQILETSPVDAYLGTHSGLLGHTVPFTDHQRLNRSCEIASNIRNVVATYFSHSILRSVFRSQQGMWKKETAGLPEAFSKSKASIDSKTSLSQKPSALKHFNTELPSQMDLLLELLCALVVNSADEVQATSALLILNRFLSRYSPGALASANGLKDCGFTEAHLDQYTTMVEQLFTNGSSGTKDIAVQCMMSISSARGGLRHHARTVSFLHKAGGSVAKSATSNIDDMLANVSCVLRKDSAQATTDSSLETMVQALWTKLASTGCVLAPSCCKAVKMMVYGLLRVFSRSLSKLSIDTNDPKDASRIWLETMVWIPPTLQTTLAQRCSTALGTAGCPTPTGALEDASRCGLVWAPARLFENLPADTLSQRVKESGLVKLHGNAQLRPFEQVMLTAAIEGVIESVLQAQVDCPGQVDSLSSEEEWWCASFWSNETARVIWRQTQCALQPSHPLSSEEKSVVDPCDHVLTFLCDLMKEKFAVIESFADRDGDAVMAAVESPLEPEEFGRLAAVVRLLLLNVTAATNPMESCVARELSLRLEVGDLTKISVSTAQDGLPRLIEDTPSSYWESSGSVGNHIIEIALAEGLVLSGLGVRVDRQDGSYCPRKLEVSLQRHGDSRWQVFGERTIEPRGNQVCMLAEELDASDEYKAARVRIVKNYDNGNDSRVHGLVVMGRPKGNNRQVCIAESVTHDILSCSQHVFALVRSFEVTRGETMSMDSKSALYQLDAATRTLIGAASVLALVSSKNKMDFLLGLTRKAIKIGDAVESESAKSASDSAGSSHIAILVALNAVLDSVKNPLTALEVLWSSQSSSTDHSTVGMLQSIESVLEYGCWEVAMFLSPSSVMLRDCKLACSEFWSLGRTPCVHFISHVQAGLFSLCLPDASENCLINIDDYISLYCGHAQHAVNLYSEALNKSPSKENIIPVSWAENISTALSRCFLSSSLGALMVASSRLDWMRMEQRTQDALISLISAVLPLADADHACSSVLGGGLDLFPSKMQCPAGHDLQRKVVRTKNLCSLCDQEISLEMKILSCPDCSHHVCRGCAYLSGCFFAKRSPKSCCTPSVWVALAINAFYNCAAIKLFESDTEEGQSSAPTLSLVTSYRLLFSAGSLPSDFILPLRVPLLERIRRSDGFSPSSESLLNVLDHQQLEAVHKIFYALLHHCRLDLSVLRGEDTLPAIFVECFLKAVNIVAERVQQSKLLSSDVRTAIDDVIGRANFLLHGLGPSVDSCDGHTDHGVSSPEEPIGGSPNLRDADPISPLARQWSNGMSLPNAHLFPAPLIRSESQNSVMRRTAAAATGDDCEGPPTSHAELWEVGDRREIAEAVVSFLTDKDTCVESVQARLRDVQSMCERRCRALQMANRLTSILVHLVPHSPLRTNFVRLVLINLQGCREWMGAGVVRCSATDSFRRLLKGFMETHVLAALRSDDDDEKLCGIAALSAAWPEEDFGMLVSSGIWDAVLALCKAKKDAARDTGACLGAGHKPIKLPAEANVTVHSTSANFDAGRNVLDVENTSTYWQSDVGTNPERWIIFEVSPPQVLLQVTLHCADDQDRGSGYAPRDVAVEIGQTPDGLDRLTSTSIPVNTNGPFPLLPSGRGSSSADVCSFIKLKVVECGGRNCRVRGLSFELKRTSEASANLPAVTVLGRAAATSMVLTAFTRTEAAPLAPRPSPLSRVISSLIRLLQPAGQYEPSTQSFAMGLIALGILTPEGPHPELLAGRCWGDLIQSLMTLYGQVSTAGRVISQALGLLQIVMRNSRMELCDTAAVAAWRGFAGGAGGVVSRSKDKAAVPSGSTCVLGMRFLEVACDLLDHHRDSPTKLVVARQSLTDLFLELARIKPCWTGALSAFSRQQVVVLQEKLDQGPAGLPPARPQSRAQCALSLLGGHVPILVVGCSAKMENGDIARVLHYELGDLRAGVVATDGFISFVSSSTLAPAPPQYHYLQFEDMTILLPLFERSFRDSVQDHDMVISGDEAQLPLLEMKTRLLRCVVEHASRSACSTGQQLDSCGLLSHLVDISMQARPRGALEAALNRLEEQMAAYESLAIQHSMAAKDLGITDASMETATSLNEAEDGDAQLSEDGAKNKSCASKDAALAAGKYLVARDSIWSLVLEKDSQRIPTASTVATLLTGVHRELSQHSALKAALFLLPSFPKCHRFLAASGASKGVCSGLGIGDIGRELLERGIMSFHPMELIEEAIMAFASHGGEETVAGSCGLELLRGIQARLVSNENLICSRKASLCRQTVEAFPLASRNSEWSVSMEFVGGMEFSVQCDPGLLRLGTISLYHNSKAAAVPRVTAPMSTKDLLATIRPGDDKARAEEKLAGKGCHLHIKFVPSSTVETSKVAARLVAESDVSAVAVESEHRYKDNVSYRGSVVFEGASELSIEFDKRCATESGCDKLTFFLNDQYKSDSFSTSHEFSGTGESNWRSFTVKADRIFYTFLSDSSRNDWGYRFIVRNVGEVFVNDEANAQLTVARLAINAAMRHSRLLPSILTREWCEVLARISSLSTGVHHRSFLSCLSRLVVHANDFPLSELPPDACFEKIIRRYVADFEAHVTSGDPIGSSDLLAHAHFICSWDSCGLRMVRKSITAAISSNLVESDEFKFTEGAVRPAAQGSSDAQSEATTERRLVIKSLATPGKKVVRGRDWSWGDQDGSAGTVGEVFEKSGVSEGWCCVRWPDGRANDYRVGLNGKYDLALHEVPDGVGSNGSAKKSAAKAVDEASVAVLLEMGFELYAVHHALRMHNNVSAAAEWLSDSASAEIIMQLKLEHEKALASAAAASTEVEVDSEVVWNSSVAMDESSQSGTGVLIERAALLTRENPYLELELLGSDPLLLCVGICGPGPCVLAVFHSDGNMSLAADPACPLEVTECSAKVKRVDSTLEGMEVIVGQRVILAPGYQECGDAASGPLQEGVEGVIVETSREPGGRVRASNSLDSDRRWWYDRRALMLALPPATCKSSVSESAEFRAGDRVAVGLVVDLTGEVTGEVRLVKNGCCILRTCQLTCSGEEPPPPETDPRQSLTAFVWLESEQLRSRLRLLPPSDRSSIGLFLVRDSHPGIVAARSLAVVSSAAGALFGARRLPCVLLDGPPCKSAAGQPSAPAPPPEWLDWVRQKCIAGGDSCAAAASGMEDGAAEGEPAWPFSAYCAMAALMSVQNLDENTVSTESLELGLKSACQPELRASFRELLGICERYTACGGGQADTGERDEVLRSRARVVARMSLLMQSLLPVASFGSADDDATAALPLLPDAHPSHALRLAARLLLKPHKEPVIKRLLSQVSRPANERPSVSLDRFRAQQATSATGENSVFHQVFLQIGRTHGTRLFGDRWWRVSLQGESVSDGGGAFRDSLSTLAAELMGGVTPLFIEAGGAWGRCVVPNPSCHELPMFEFVGQLMGACLHSGERLALTLPPFVWRRLAGHAVTWEDFAAFEPELAGLYDRIERNEFPVPGGSMSSYSAEEFEDVIALDFTLALGVPVRTVELVPRGARVAVTLDNRRDFVRLAREARLRAYDVQVRAMRVGLRAYCPDSVLALWSSFELELAVCGEPHIPLDKFKEATRFQGDERQKTMFLWCFERLTMHQRSLLLRFVSGRSRLPCPMTIDFGHGVPDSLPRAATCGNHLTLPPYTSQERMLEAVVQAIEVCQDFGAEG